MKVETYIVTWNREDTIHLTIKHYLELGSVIIYDNWSTDRTREIAESLGAEVRVFGQMGVLDDQAYKDLKNNCWKKSTADWVIVVDDDEILLLDNTEYLKNTLLSLKIEGYSIVKPRGYAMFSNDMPVNNWTEIKTGIIDNKYSKLCCFNPKKITDIGYEYGCHTHMKDYPKGDVSIFDGLFLLHYNAVGGPERMIKRHQLYEPRRQRSAVNMKWGLGKEYGYSAESKRIWFKEQLEKSEILFGDGLPF
jgi:glycosyltransferase involved in cell wall biosynthesis